MVDWSHWHNEPYLVGGLTFLAWFYAVMRGPLRKKPQSKQSAVCFYSSLLIFYIAVGSPLDQIGEKYLLTAHMVQHQLLIYPAAILFIFGLPAELVDETLRRMPLGFVQFIFSPLICCLIYSLTLSAWHIPALYDLALQNRWVHIGEHLCFFIAALFYWWPLVSKSKVAPSISQGGKMLYLGAVTIAMTPVFAAITFSSDVLYPTYEFAPRFFADLSAIEDQKLGGALMKAGGLFVSIVTMTIAFFRWSAAESRQAG